MKLIELELNNIKSYKQEIIKFGEGINCILGLNGSGKSTIIESIGNVLFNYNPRTTSEVLRYNEKTGKIILIFEGIDNKRYKIIRTFKANSSPVKLIDEETNEVLFDSVSDVYTFVKKVLGIPKEKNISKLFEEIIAVPQGTFVNAFLDTPSIRKPKFDKLFDLDIYKSLSEAVKKINDIVEKEHIHNLDKDIATLSGKLTNYDSLTNEYNKINKDIIEAEEKLNHVTDIYNKKTNEKKDLEELNNSLEKANKELNDINIKKATLKQSIQELNDKIKISNQSKLIVKENEFAYQLYKITNTQLIENEIKYNKYLSLQDLLNKNNVELIKIENSKNTLEGLIHTLKINKGNDKQQVIDTNEEINKLQEQINHNTLKLIPLKNEIALKEKQLETTKLNYQLKVNKLNDVSNYLLSYNKDINKSKINEEIDSIVNKLDIIFKNKEQINILEKELISLTKDLENLNINHTYMKDGMCPILKQKCLTIKGNDLTTEISNMISTINNNIQKVNENINELIEKNKEEENLVKSKEYLELQKINCLNDQKKYRELMDDLKNSFDEIDIIDETNDTLIISDLLKKYNNLIQNFKDEELNSLKNEESSLVSLIISNQAKINIDKNKVAELEKQIQKNDNELSIKEAELKDILKEIDIKTNNINETKESLALYSGIKDTIEENKKVLDNNKAAYELYISNKEKSDEYESLINILNISNKDLEQLDTKIEKLQKQIADINSKYSKQVYDELQKEINDLSSEISSFKTAINFQTERKEAINNEITYLNELITSKKEKEVELIKYQKLSNQYKIIREVYNNLPKVLSEQIRKHISTYSSNLYRNISGENVRIELLDDYEVKLIDCSDESKVKSLNQLSGGEQMSVAISIRLAMLKQTTGVQFYFMDEPTVNLDTERRMKVADVVKDMANELKQLYVISHDDTFEGITDNIIKVVKVDNISKLES